MLGAALIREADSLGLGYSDGSVRDLTVLRHLRLHGTFRPPLHTRVGRWRPPAAGWYKVNVDGSFDGSPGMIFGGAIFRNSRGFFVAAFSRPVGWGLPLEAELAAALWAVRFAFNRGWLRLWLETNSEMVVRFLNAPHTVIPWRLRSLWREFLIMRASMELTVTHIFQEANQAADLLAKHHHSQEWIGVWPEFIDHFLYSDLHSDYFRLVRTS